METENKYLTKHPNTFRYLRMTLTNTDILHYAASIHITGFDFRYYMLKIQVPIQAIYHKKGIIHIFNLPVIFRKGEKTQC